MNIIRTISLLSGLALITATNLSLAAEDESPATKSLTAREIMQKVYDRDDGNHAITEMEMILVDKNGNQRVRNVKSFGRDVEGTEDDTQSIMFFLSPADVKDTGFLTYDYDDPDKDDDQWLYLPALKKVKRIASSDKSSSFMGTDFTNADMTKRSIENYEYKLVKEDEVDGKKVWVIESTPITEKEKEETGYTKSYSFVRQDNFVVIRGINFVKKGKRIKYMDTKKLEQVDGIWVATELTMKTTKNKETLHSTILRINNIEFNKPQPEDTFTTRRLEQGL